MLSGLSHEFMVVSHHIFEYGAYIEFLGHPSALRVRDDLVRYMGDSLVWIPSHLPSQGTLIQFHGLNLYGPTILKVEGASVACKVIHAWIDLFSCGPVTFTLTGAYTSEPDQPWGAYEQITVNRDEAVHQLKQLHALCRAVAESNERLYLLHLGI